jgi:hypothetical protein
MLSGCQQTFDRFKTGVFVSSIFTWRMPMHEEVHMQNTQTQIKEVNLQTKGQTKVVTISSYFYVVDLGADVHPQFHHVGKDKRCTCGLGVDCLAVKAVINYLKDGGEQTPEPPAGYFPVVPQVCPVCGGDTFYVPLLNSKHRGAGWACVTGGETHYWLSCITALRKALADNPWVFPPVFAVDGTILYPGLKRDEIITESQPWSDGYNPDQ